VGNRKRRSRGTRWRAHLGRRTKGRPAIGRSTPAATRSPAGPAAALRLCAGGGARAREGLGSALIWERVAKPPVARTRRRGGDALAMQAMADSARWAWPGGLAAGSGCGAGAGGASPRARPKPIG
jgi:hypothetical protein